jgi:hypothetical protein
MRFSDLIFPLSLSLAVASVSVGVVDRRATFTPQNMCDAQKLSHLTGETVPKNASHFLLSTSKEPGTCWCKVSSFGRGTLMNSSCSVPQNAEGWFGSKREIEDRLPVAYYVPVLWRGD